MTRERIENFREIVLPFVKKRLLEINYENLGESDAEMFAKDFDEILNLAIKALDQEPTTKIDYRRAFKIACDLLNGDILYGVDTDKIFELMMQKDGVVSSSSYREYILCHLQELDQGQYASESVTSTDSTTKNDLEVDAISRRSVIKEMEKRYADGDYITKGFINSLPSVTPISKDCTDCIAEDKTFMKMDRIKQLLNSDKLDDSEVLEKIIEVVEE